MGNEIQPQLNLHPGVAFQINGTDILFDDGRLISLNDLWKSAGSPEMKDPRRYLQTEQGAGFVEELAKSLNVAKNVIWKSRRGKHLGGTWAHWQVAFAYAEYLSHEFHRKVHEAAREWIKEAIDPDLKADRTIELWRRRGKDDQWIAARLQGKLDRNNFTKILQEHGVKRNGPNDNGFAHCTNAINVKVVGGTAKRIKKLKGLKDGDLTRDHLSTVELRGISLAEALASEQIPAERAYGNKECETVCVHVGGHVRSAIVSARQPKGITGVNS